MEVKSEVGTSGRDSVVANDRAAKLQRAAEALGFDCPELMVHYFKTRLLNEGLYEALNERAAQQAIKQ
jgi:hypothetical protein